MLVIPEVTNEVAKVLLRLSKVNLFLKASSFCKIAQSKNEPPTSATTSSKPSSKPALAALPNEVDNKRLANVELPTAEETPVTLPKPFRSLPPIISVAASIAPVAVPYSKDVP